ncbi:MAG: hypothetical protein HY801_11530, partial [Candidatus Lindowbacteria bacterium]|nr:hypothetical protein [Candidatus Lindowbacteria bacterium]
MRCGTVAMIVFALAFALCSFPVPAEAETATVEMVPKWNVGDTWKYHSEKALDRTVTQGAGLLQITMTLKKAENNTSYTVADTQNVGGEDCYVVRVSGDQKITGTYNTMPIQGEAAAGDLAQTSTFEGSEYRR